MDDQFTLDFDRVPLGQKSRLELTVTNLTDIDSGIQAKVAKFKTRVSEHMSERQSISEFYKNIDFSFSLYHRLMDAVRKLIWLSVIALSSFRNRTFRANGRRNRRWFSFG